MHQTHGGNTQISWGKADLHRMCGLSPRLNGRWRNPFINFHRPILALETPKVHSFPFFWQRHLFRSCKILRRGQGWRFDIFMGRCFAEETSHEDGVRRLQLSSGGRVPWYQEHVVEKSTNRNFSSNPMSISRQYQCVDVLYAWRRQGTVVYQSVETHGWWRLHQGHPTHL